MVAYNPQMMVQLNEILPDGSDIPFEVDFLEGMPRGELGLGDLTHHSANKPLKVTARIRSDIGGTMNTCSLSINNPLYIETFRKNPQAELNKFKGKKFRLRVWAWYDDNSSLTPIPPAQIWPVFVGDVLDGFNISAQGVNDVEIVINSQGHSWLAGSGKYRKTWKGGTDYFVIVNEIMDEIVNARGQGQETDGSAPQFFVDDFDGKLAGKVLPSSFSVNRNPVEVLNDICRELDMVWGVHNNIPYIVSRDRPFQMDKLPISRENVLREEAVEVNYKTGLISNISYGISGFSFSHNFDKQLFIGRMVEASDEPQTGDGSTFVAGRITSVGAVIDNYDGNVISCNCSYVDYNEDSPTKSKVILPEKRQDNSGLRNV